MEINSKKGITNIIIEHAICLIQWRPKKWLTFAEALDTVQQLLKMIADLKHLNIIHNYIDLQNI